MSMPAKLATLALIGPFLTGCAGVPPVNCVDFDPGGQMCLLPPALLPAMDGAHMVSIDRDGKQQTFIGQLHIDAQAIRLAGSSLFGPSLFSVSYDGHELRSEPVNGSRHADMLIAMLELALAEPQALQPVLHGMTLQYTTQTDGTRVRELFEHGRRVAHIEVSAGLPTHATVRIEILPAHLSVLMQPLASAP